MKIKVTVLLLLIFLVSQSSTIALQAAPPFPPDSPWISELIDDADLRVVSGISTTRLPGNDRLAVAYTHVPDLGGSSKLKFAVQVPSGTGNCGEYLAWKCMDLDGGKPVGPNISLAAIQDIKNKNYIHVGISYYDELNKNLKYAYNLYDAPADYWLGWSFITVDNRQMTGQASSLIFDPITGQPVIAYRWLDRSDAIVDASLMTATIVGQNNGTCGPNASWACTRIDSVQEPYFETLMHIGVGLINREVYYFFNLKDGLHFAKRDPESPINCINTDYRCTALDATGEFVGHELKVSSWSGNLPGNPNENPPIWVDGVFLAYKDLNSKSIKYAISTGQGNGDCGGYRFSCGTVFEYEDEPFENKSLSVAMDLKYNPVLTFSAKEYYGNNIYLARASDIIGGTDSAICRGQYGKWSCDPVLTLDENFSAGGFAGLDISAINLVSVIYNPMDTNSMQESLELVSQEGFRVKLPIISRK